MSRRSVLLASVTGLVALLMWQLARADAPTVSHAAQRQIAQIVPSLIDSEAEHASGAYIPGVGAVFILDVARGPNALPNKTPSAGIRDWGIYLMQTFGRQLDAVPPSEIISFSIEFYDYTNVVYHQFVVTSRAGETADPARYLLWLDGRPYSEATQPVATSVSRLLTPSPAPLNSPTVLATSVGSPRTPGAPTTTVTLLPNRPFTITFNLTDPQVASKDWKPVNGQWTFTPQGYIQSELGKFDLVTYFREIISGDYDLQVDMQYRSGEMGGGIVFNAPTNTSKNGAQMISYAGGGTYLQWGYFDNIGVFQFEGGANVPSGADSQRHTLLVRVRGDKYNIALDGTTVGQALPLSRGRAGFLGLLVSTSNVVFNNLRLQSVGP